ncbi:MAG TPA: flagellar motor protein MotB, partial [Acidimicrobiia bacterium]|nr:flagellar motor protein MotB [Acidimicrobiia bacterium]
ADLLTLLMAMFIALFAISTVNVSKFKDLALGFNQALGGGKLATTVFAGPSPKDTSPIPGNGYGNGPASGGSLVASDNVLTATQLAQLLNATDNLQNAKARQAETLAAVQQAIEARARARGYGAEIHTALQARGLVVTVVTDKVLFDSGSAAILPGGGSLLGLIADALKAVPNPVLIDGYTDSVPISTAQYPSNLELSSARADRVAEYFTSSGLADTRMFPEGLGARDPLMSNATPAGRARNRRVEIIVQSSVVNETLANAGLDQAATSTPTPAQPQVHGGVTAGVTPSNANINPHLGAN